MPGSQLRDSYAVYKKWREACPLIWTDEFFGGAWLLTTFEGVRAALRDPRLSARRTGGWIMARAPRGSAERGDRTELQRLFARAMVFVDDPNHSRLRQAIQAGFHPAAIDNLKPHIASYTHELLDTIENNVGAGNSFDFISGFARLLPARVISKLLGLEWADNNHFMEWSSGVAQFLGAVAPTLEEAQMARSSIVAMSAHFDGARRAGKGDGDGLLHLLSRAEAAGRIKSGPELLAQCAMLLFAGYETTRHLLGTAIYWLLRHPDAWAQLKADPSLVRGAVRELLRWDSPIQYTGRRVKSDFELYGQRLRRGQLVLAMIGSANRDPAEFSEPDEMRLERSVGLPISFGYGPHVCIGARLTLVEAELALNAIVHRWPELRLGSEEPRWIRSPLYRGLITLPLYLQRTRDL